MTDLAVPDAHLPRLGRVLQDLRANGWCCIRRGGADALGLAAARLGAVLHSTDVVVRPSSRALVTSARALGPHTDHSRADFVAWLCVEPADRGGETMLVDAWPVLALLPARSLELLREVQLFEHRVFPSDPERHPLLSYDSGPPSVYYTYWLRCELDAARAHALDQFRALVESSANQVRFRLERGDVLIVDNHRVLHGRTAIALPSRRHLRRLWIERNKEHES
jgi:alpha-ketoglutarate-dependent taurine dioxygenase